MLANRMTKRIAESIQPNVLRAFKDMQQAIVWKKNAELKHAWTAITSTVPTIAALSTPTLVAVYHVRNAIPHAYAQKARARRSVKRPYPSATTNATITQARSTIAVGVIRLAIRTR